MAIEIERKFIVKNNLWKSKFLSKDLCIQGYLHESFNLTTRVRIISDDAYITIKGIQKKYSRNEYEYKIPILDAEQILSQCKYLISKDRYTLSNENSIWTIDVFKNENKGLILAEIELDEDSQEFKRPIWLGDEVSLDMNYSNLRLAINPYKNWNN
tara:strand:+ start:3631 stop:4098 length:468 start_codon:yes stop_codon:yes gene_type:complete